jgi:hypothetical protein
MEFTTGQDLTVLVLTAATSFLALFAAAWAAIRWTRRPRLICGIPPSRAEQKRNPELERRLGSASVAAGFHHRRDCLAEPFTDRKVISTRDRARFFADPLRCRRVAVSADRSITIAVVLQNSGDRMAKDYSASIAFLPEGCDHIQLVDVRSESLALADIYTTDAEALTPELRERAAPPAIVAAYDDYLWRLPPWGDAVFLTGSLQAAMFELVSLRIRVPAETKRFLVVYTLECSDGWTQAVKYIQGCRLDPPTAGQSITETNGQPRA